MFTSGVTHMRAALFRDNFGPGQMLAARPERRSGAPQGPSPGRQRRTTPYRAAPPGGGARWPARPVPSPPGTARHGLARSHPPGSAAGAALAGARLLPATAAGGGAGPAHSAPAVPGGASAGGPARCAAGGVRGGSHPGSLGQGRGTGPCPPSRDPAGDLCVRFVCLTSRSQSAVAGPGVTSVDSLPPHVGPNPSKYPRPLPPPWVGWRTAASGCRVPYVPLCIAKSDSLQGSVTAQLEPSQSCHEDGTKLRRGMQGAAPQPVGLEISGPDPVRIRTEL